MAETGDNQTDEQTTEYIRDPILDTEEMKKLFVGGIAADTEEAEIIKFLQEISPESTVTKFDKIKKESSGDSKSCFGFAIFETSEQLDELLLKRSELTFNGKKLEVNRAIPKKSASPGSFERTKKLFIANLPRNNCTEDDLKKYFEARHNPKYGTIESIQLVKKKDEQGNKTEENRGYGFVIVSSEDMADKMAIQHSNFEFGGRKIEMKKSVPNSDSGAGRGRGRGQHGGFNAPPPHFGGGGYGEGWQDPWYGGGYGPGYDMYSYGQRFPPPMRGGRGGRGRYAPY